MKLLPGSLYNYPRYYDIAFGDRPLIERDFLIDCYALFARRPLKRIYEPATGSGRLLAEFVRQGYRVSGCDLSAAAIAFGNARLRRLGHPPSLVQADMCQFRPAPPADLAFNLISTFQHLPDEERAEAHLKIVAAGLARGGIYFLGLQLLPTQGRRNGTERWEARRGSITVSTCIELKRLDRRKRVDYCSMVARITTPRGQEEIREPLHFRTYTWTQMRSLLARVPEFRLVATYDFHYEVYNPIVVGPKTQDVILVLLRV